MSSKSSSRSRSRSPRRDRHGWRSRNSRSRSRSRDMRLRRHGRRYSRSKSRERSTSRHASHRPSPPARNRTNIEDPKYLNARVFIGNLPADKVTKEELEGIFVEHGTVLGVSVHDRGYGFVQYEKEEQARKSVEMENGSLLKGNVLDVKMAAEGRKGAPGRQRPKGSPPPYDREGGDRAGYGPPGRDRSPTRSEPFDERYRDPFVRRSPPPPGARGRDDPFYPDPYRRPPPPQEDPYFDRYREDPYRYRRDPFADPYRERDPYFRDPYDAPLPPPALPPKKAIPIDCQIIMMNVQLRDYAEALVTKLQQASIMSDVCLIPEDRTVPQMVEEASLKKCLFAIVINTQNESHRSLTLNILHGTPQEHRNMPAEDAVTLVISSFETYMTAQKEKLAAPPAPKPGITAAAGAFVPPSSDISYLLNLLADNRQLTLEEIEKVMNYLKERKDKLLVAAGHQQLAVPAVARPAVAGAGDTNVSSAYLQQEQQQLQAKILSILNGSSSSPSTPSVQSVMGQTQATYNQGMAASVQPVPAKMETGLGHGSSSLINFDNPNVQKALDNLIQSGPNLLRSIPSTVSTQSSGLSANMLSRPATQAPTHSQSGGYQAQGHSYQPNHSQQAPISHQGQQRPAPGGYHPRAQHAPRAQQPGVRPRMI